MSETGKQHQASQPDDRLERMIHIKLPQQKKLEEYLCKLMFSYLQSTGCFTKNFTDISPLIRNAGIIDKFIKWMNATRDFLCEKSYLKIEDDEYVIKKVIAKTDLLWAEWENEKKEWMKDPGMKAQVLLVEATLKALPDILKGTIPARDIMFPDSSMRLVEGIYKNNEVSDYFNDILTDVIITYLKICCTRDPDIKIRIFEIGAGTGGTSALVFRRLEEWKDHVAEYCYTDISQAFLMHGKKEYGSHPYITYKLFNVSNSLKDQDIKPGMYDLVIAANVLHATKNMKETIRNAKALLKKNGIILINEVINKSLFTHLTFGLLEGWWLYEDEWNRIPGSPALYPEMWQKLLDEEGFTSIAYPVKNALCLGQQIIAGTSNGIIRQKHIQSKQKKGHDHSAGIKNKEPGLSAKQTHTKKRSHSSPEKDTGTDDLKNKTREYIKNIVAETLKIPIHRIDTSEDLEKYGIDSILIVQLTNALRNVFDDVSSTIFFEYKNINDLSDYFLQTKKETLIQLVGYSGESKQEEKNVTKNKIQVNKKRDTGKKRGRIKYSGQRPAPSNIDIAIIGVSGKYPGADNLYAFWDNLKNGKNCITEIPPERWDWRDYYDEKKGKEGKIYSKWGGFINDYDTFDPLFFKISPKEAERMDPQERLFLQQAYASIEDAGYTPGTLSTGNKVGVFVGVMNGNYPMGASYWSIANRISYLFNYSGPSMAIDTACSSSLTAIHLACENIKNGIVDCAIAGGVNLIVSPMHYMRLSALTMLSEGNACKAFGKDADGFVDSEGAGAIILKSLSNAIEDHDHIYGIIKGSMLNAGGKTNGFTVPNPIAQGEVFGDAVKRAGISYRSITYIEAHGTGTSLGDPIEITGLRRAFEHEKTDEQYCAIGSVKSNIGHSESAAGIAGLTKILLQMKYKKLVPSLHTKELNPEINLTHTPFYIQKDLTIWESSTSRTAGLSSFGAGGANACLILQEHSNHEIENSVPDAPVIIVLSAKNESALKKRAEDVLMALEWEEYNDTHLRDIAYTLQVGREEMTHRLGFTAFTIEDVKNILKDYISGKARGDILYTGEFRKDKNALATLAADEDMAETILAWCEKGKQGKFLELWVEGLSFNWMYFYEDGIIPKRISLPTYPFSKERYWIDNIDFSASGHAGGEKHHHPLIQKNTSTLAEQKYSSQFTGNEDFFIYKGSHEKVFSIGAYLEMARSAIKEAGETEGNIILTEVAWEIPAGAAGEPVQLHIGIFPGENNSILFEIYSYDENGVPVIHCRGCSYINSEGEDIAIDVEKQQKRDWDKRLTSDDVSPILGNINIFHHPEFKSVENVFIGHNEALIRLTSRTSPVTGTRDFCIHPVMYDTIIQVAASLTGKNVTGNSLDVLKIDKVMFCAYPGTTMWILIHYHDYDNKTACDIDVYDESGTLCIRMIGIELDMRNAKQRDEVLFFAPEWKEQTPATGKSVVYAGRLIFLCEPDNITASDIETGLIGSRCFVLQPGNSGTGIDERFIAYSRTIIREIKNIRKENPEGQLLVQAYASGEGDARFFPGLSGIFKSAQHENLKIAGQFIESEESDNLAGIIGKLEENAGTGITGRIRYKTGKRFIEGLKEVQFQDKEPVIPWKKDGVYLITGGTGGLGYIVAADFAEKSKKGTLILTGRSSLNEEKKGLIQNLEKQGILVDYRKSDVSRKKDVDNLIEHILQKYGKLNGIIHSAGVLRDRVILDKQDEEIKEVLDPKIKGVINLDMASREVKLDFFIFFSSIAGFFGNTGQADYAAANAFMDIYAEYRNEMVALTHGHGKSISINWPLWREGGMKLNEEIEKMMMLNLGMSAMTTENGLRSLYMALFSDFPQILVLSGNADKIKKIIHIGELPPPAVNDQVAEKSIHEDVIQREIMSSKDQPGKGRKAGMKGLSVEECIEWELKAIISEIIKIDQNKIKREDNLADYGFDSITLGQFSDVLGKYYGIEFTPATFYGYSTLEKLTGYFIKEYKQEMKAFYAEEKTANVSHTRKTVKEKINKKPFSGRSRFSLGPAFSGNNEAIAIIGMSGRFPEARTISEMWEILEQGRNVIKEYPSDRAWSTGSSSYKWKCGCIPGVREFDPLFFEISPMDAETIDPRQRLLVQESWKALEDAGYGAEQIANQTIGMFVGAEQSDYQHFTGKKATVTSHHESVLAARLAYFLNFSGPVLTINTACSSGLVAVHQACRSLQNGECTTALAAGVNLFLIPALFEILNETGMLSKTGICHAFDRRANGFVPGEAVAVVVLKKLSLAERDNDPIYAVIKGSGVNYDGKTNGITAPSGTAQINLLKNVYEKNKINPEDIEYIVTHGTGTRLGDPIEVNALNEVFKSYTKKHEYCAITSAKTNFGHTLAASGILSLISLVQSLVNEKIPASINFEEKNEYIQWKDSPFYVNTENRRWSDKNGKKRIGAVSAFGISGTNAHAVVESYKNENRGDNQPDLPFYLLPFSAKTSDILKDQLSGMVSYLEKENSSIEELSRICYTLHECRYHFNYRCAIVVRDIENAVVLLKKAIHGEKITRIFTGNVPHGFIPQKSIDEYSSDLIDQLLTLTDDETIYQEKLYGLAELYCQGYTIPWHKIYSGNKPLPIRIPTYPFSREEYWIEGEESKPGGKDSSISSIHPLIHKNDSDFIEQRFFSKFTGAEFFLSDHVINGRMTLPGVCYLEMARCAIEISGAAMFDRLDVKLKNVVWIEPFTLDNIKPKSIYTSLDIEENQTIQFKVYSSDENDTIVLHNKGIAEIRTQKKEPEDQRSIDIDTLKMKTDTTIIGAKKCYEAFQSIGIDYGPGFRGIESLYIGVDTVLARLSLPESVSSDTLAYTLHPSMLDSAFQATIGVFLKEGKSSAAIPFAVDEVEIFQSCEAQMWAVIKVHKGENVTKFDIDLCNNSGIIYIKVKGLSARIIKDEQKQDLLLVEPLWKEQPAASDSPEYEYAEKLLFLCETETIQEEKMISPAKNMRIITLNVKAEKPRIEDRYLEYAKILIKEIQAVLKSSPRKHILVQVLILDKKYDMLFSGLSGILKTAQKENPFVIGQSIQISGDLSPDDIMTILNENAGLLLSGNVMYKDGKRFCEGFKELIIDDKPITFPWKDDGVYLITGGMGKIGRIFSEEIIKNVKIKALLLTGKSALTEEREAWIQQEKKKGVPVFYHQVNITEKEDVKKYIENMTAEYGPINGILHCAGVIRDSFLVHKEIQDVDDVFGPKVKGLVNLDEATKDMNLDWFILFSSLSGVTGNLGQADYSAANAFMDAYADYRKKIAMEKKRAGKTITINWPLWKDGGMSIDKETENIMIRETGMRAMKTITGIRAFYQALMSGKNKIIVMEGDLDKMRDTLQKANRTVLPDAEYKNKSGAGMNQADLLLLDKLQTDLAETLADVFDIDNEKIEFDKEIWG